MITKLLKRLNTHRILVATLHDLLNKTKEETDFLETQSIIISLEVLVFSNLAISVMFFFLLWKDPKLSLI